MAKASPKTPPTNDVVAQALEDALALMNDKGSHWLKGGFRRTDRKTREVSFCSLGAIRETTKGRPDVRKAAIAKLAEELPGHWLSEESTITTWNDAYNRKWPDIVKIFNRAIKKLHK